VQATAARRRRARGAKHPAGQGLAPGEAHTASAGVGTVRARWYRVSSWRPIGVVASATAAIDTTTTGSKIIRGAIVPGPPIFDRQRVWWQVRIAKPDDPGLGIRPPVREPLLRRGAEVTSRSLGTEVIPRSIGARDAALVTAAAAWGTSWYVDSLAIVTIASTVSLVVVTAVGAGRQVGESLPPRRDR